MARRFQVEILGQDEQTLTMESMGSCTQIASHTRSMDRKSRSELADWQRLSREPSVGQVLTLRLLTSWPTLVVLVVLALLPSIR